MLRRWVFTGWGRSFSGVFAFYILTYIQFTITAMRSLLIRAWGFLLRPRRKRRRARAFRSNYFTNIHQRAPSSPSEAYPTTYPSPHHDKWTSWKFASSFVQHSHHYQQPTQILISHLILFTNNRTQTGLNIIIHFISHFVHFHFHIILTGSDILINGNTVIEKCENYFTPWFHSYDK